MVQHSRYRTYAAEEDKLLGSPGGRAETVTTSAVVSPS